MTDAFPSTTRSHLLASLKEAGRTRICQVLDLANSDASWLRKHLECRALAQDPELAGMPWRLDLRLAGSQDKLCLRLSAWVDEDPPRCVAREAVPLENLLWIGMGMIRQLGVDSADLDKYQLVFAAIDNDDPLVREAESNQGDNALEVASEATDWLRFPEDFSTRPLGPVRRIFREVRESWMRCAFTEGAWAQFAAAAEAESEVERALGAPLSMHLVDRRCYLVVGQPVDELPSEASPASLITHGRHLFDLHRRFSGKYAYCHLHPRSVNGVAMTPYPSGPDVTVAWNLNASTILPVCLPIALWGTGHDPAPGDVAVHSFVDGLLSEIPLEIIGD